jgi:outer membrane protein
MRKPIVLFLVFWATFWGLELSTIAQAEAQKVGYTNIELIVSLMPEAKVVENDLRTHERKLMEQVEIKKRYFEGLVEEYKMTKEQNKMTPEQDKAKQEELMRLEKEIQKFVQDAEASMAKKKEELLNPIFEKLQAAVDKVAEEMGYGYVFNSSIGGSSVLLKGPKKDNITLPILRKLNIEIPKEVEEQLNKP